MLYRLVAYLKFLLRLSSVSQQVDEVKRRVEGLSRSAIGREKKLDQQLQELAAIRSLFQKKMETVEIELKQARDINKKLEAELHVATEALEAKDKIIIPGLVAANQMLIARWEAETSVLAMRKVAAAAERE